MIKAVMPEPEFFRPLHVEKVGLGTVHESLQARPTEREALAKRFGLIAIKRLQAELDIEQTHAGKMLAVTGSFSADVVQQCVVTLEPLESTVGNTIDALFAPAKLLDRGAGAPNIDAGEEDDPEPYVNGQIDLGELVAQHLGLALDPYPRKPGLEPLEREFTAPANDPGGRSSPFAVLKSLKDKEKGG
jgi:uncharacterized metal-binding protein YceD (DUF177 family)